MTYKICKILIENKRYNTKEEMQTKLDVFYAVNRLTDEEYMELTGMLSDNPGEEAEQ